MTINVWWDEAWDSYYAAQKANTGFTAKRVVKVLKKVGFRVLKDPECKIWEIRGHGLYGILSLPATIYYNTNLHMSVEEDWNKFSDATLQLNIFDFSVDYLLQFIFLEFYSGSEVLVRHFNGYTSSYCVLELSSGDKK